MKNFDNKKDQSHTLFDDDDSLVNMLWSTIEEDNEDSDQLERDYIDLKNRINRKEKTIRITKYRWIGGIAASLIVVFMLLNIYQRNNTPDNVYAKIQDIEKSVIPDQVILSSNDGLSVVLDEAAIIEGSENNCHVLLTSSGVKKDIKATEILKITVPDGRQFMLTLSDGSKVWLNSGSELEYPATFIGQTYRKVKLNGEAFFDIMPDKETPFYVETVHERIVKVLGTSFNISAYANSESQVTTLVTGKIAYKASLNDNEIILTPGKQIGQNLKSGDILMKDVDVRYFTAWKEGLLWFENTKLSELIPRLERQYGVTIKYPETERNAAFSGKISVDKGLDYIFYLLSQTTGIECEVNDNEIHLIKRN